MPFIESKRTSTNVGLKTIIIIYFSFKLKPLWTWLYKMVKSILLSLVLISHQLTCDVVAGCNWQHSAICPNGFPAHLRWIANILKFAQNANQVMEFSTILPFKYGSNCLTEVCCECRWCSHKMFSFPTTTDLPAKLKSMPRTDYVSLVSAINFHICGRVVPGRAGSYALGIVGGIWKPGFNEVGACVKLHVCFMLGLF